MPIASTKHTVAAAADVTMRRARPLDKDKKKRLVAQPTAANGRGGGKPTRELWHPKRSFENVCRNYGGAKSRPCSNMRSILT